MRRLRAALALALIGALTLSVPAGAAGPKTETKLSGPRVDKASAIVVLKGAPLTTSAKTKPTGGKKVDFNSSTTKAYRAQLAALRNDYKAWLRTAAPKARVSSEFDIALNGVSVRLNGHTLAQVSGSPLVARAQYSGVYYPLGHDDPDLALIDALQAWAQGTGLAAKGDGVKVAIVDTGIDATHPCFSDAGYPESNNPGADNALTNDKVIFAGVFNMKTRSRGYTPHDRNGHGTHVAGTVACNEHTPAVVSGVDIPYDISGVAPRALLGNFNVFPHNVANARSEDIVDALEAAYERDFDVANMSLGGGSSGNNDLLAMVTDNLDRANMVVAVAAGNSGPGHFTIESPGKAARALTAGASTVGHFVGAPVTVTGVPTFGAAAGDFPVVTADLTKNLKVVLTPPVRPNTGINEACSPLPAGSLTNTIAVVSRGTCDFSWKIRVAQLAGASAVLVANHSAGDPTAMGQGASPDGVQPTIPAYMVSFVDGQAIKGKTGASTTIDKDLAYFNTANDDIQASFSSQGPTDVDFRVKPDVMAPGVNVLSAQPATQLNAEGAIVPTCTPAPCFAFFQGTSMATPHLAGAAAVVLGQHPAWAAWQVRSAIVNTAERGIVTSAVDGTTVLTDPNVIGAGRLNLSNAVGADAVLSPVSVSFGAIPAGAGHSRSVAVTLTNVSGGTATWSLGVTTSSGTGVTYTVSPSSVTLANGASATIAVRLSAAKGASRGDHQAWLNIGSGGNVAHAAVYTFVK